MFSRHDLRARGMAGGVGKLKVIMESLEEVLEEPLDRRWRLFSSRSKLLPEEVLS